jgi:hypothetical protein
MEIWFDQAGLWMAGLETGSALDACSESPPRKRLGRTAVQAEYLTRFSGRWSNFMSYREIAPILLVFKPHEKEESATGK